MEADGEGGGWACANGWELARTRPPGQYEEMMYKRTIASAYQFYNSEY
jgi:hypothetical protein